MSIVLTPGQRHEATAFEQLMEQGAVKRKGRGCPCLRPGRIVGDKGYRCGSIRDYAPSSRDADLTIPRCSNEHRRRPLGKAIYRDSNLVERFIGRLRQYRRLATRYEKRGKNYLAMWLIAATLLWL